MTTNDYEEAVIHIAAIVGNANNLHERLERAADLAQVTIAKAAETDRLTDDNRRLRAKVEELEVERDNALQRLTNAGWCTAVIGETPESDAVALDYVTRAELIEAFASALAEVSGPAHCAFAAARQKLVSR